MDDMYRILLPTDFSDTADHALNIGVALSKRSYSQIHLLHIEDIPEDWVKLAENSENSLFSSAQKQLAEVKSELSNRVKLAEDNGAEVKSFLKYNKSYRGNFRAY
jgi:nucleotide-binding universal stress UspA family protein